MIYIILFIVLSYVLISKTIKFYILSPVYIYCLFSIITIIFSIIYFYFYDDKLNLYSLDSVSETDFLNTINLYLFSLLFFMLGVVLYYNLSKKFKRILFNTSFTEVLFFKFNYPQFLVKLTKVMFIALIFLYAVTYGWDIFIRSAYLSADHPRFLQLLIKVFSLIIVIALGLIYHGQRWLSNSLFWILIILSLGIGSRITVLYFLIYFVLIFQAKGNTFSNKLTFTLNLLLTSVFFSFLIKFRSFDSHGIVPYILGVFNNDHEVLSEFSRSFLFNIYYSFIFGVFVTIETIKDSIPDWNYIFVSLNPLPGTVAGFYEYVPSFMINPYAPYSSNGQVFVMGKFFTAFFYFSIGWIFTDIDYRVRVLFDKKKKIFAFILVFLSVLYIVYSFEYLLRSAVRYLYYLYFLVLLSWSLKKTYKILPKKSK